MKWIETLEIQRGNTPKSSFDYEINIKIKEKGYDLLKRSDEVAVLMKTMGDSLSIEEFKEEKKEQIITLIKYNKKGGVEMKKGQLLNKEEILKLRKNDNVYIVPFNKKYSDNEGLGIVELIEEEYINIKPTEGKDLRVYKDEIPPKLLKIYEYIEDKEELRKFTGIEILAMIRDNKLKVGDELIGYIKNDDEISYSFKVDKISGGTLYIKDMSQTNKKDIADSWDLINMFFILKEKEYLTFDEAKKSGKKFKHKDGDRFYRLDGALDQLSVYSIDMIERFLEDKVWEIGE